MIYVECTKQVWPGEICMWDHCIQVSADGIRRSSRACGILTYSEWVEKEEPFPFFLAVCFISNLMWTLSARLWILRFPIPIDPGVAKLGLKKGEMQMDGWLPGWMNGWWINGWMDPECQGLTEGLKKARNKKIKIEGRMNHWWMHDRIQWPQQVMFYCCPGNVTTLGTAWEYKCINCI